MNAWLVMVSIGVITFAIRLSFILLLGRVEIPQAVRQGLRYVPAAVLSAIIFPELLLPAGVLDLSPGNPRLLAGFLAILVAWRTKNVLLTISAGMVALLLLQALI